MKTPIDFGLFCAHSGSEHGVIYFSFSSCISGSELPAEKLKQFIEMFRLVKKKVLWKFENDAIPNLPSKPAAANVESCFGAQKCEIIFKARRYFWHTGCANGFHPTNSEMPSDAWTRCKRCIVRNLSICFPLIASEYKYVKDDPPTTYSC